jgi:thiamine pyrophosphate-dependent acetolactate synthase large subunit-like protein
MTAAAKMTIAEACSVLGEVRDEEMVVLTMSPIAFWPDVRDDDYRLMGLMGGAAGIGLGLALGLPDRQVWVLDGDGSLLMQLGGVAAVAEAAPRNFTHILFDNGTYAISGAQPTPAPADWEGVFRAAGYAWTVTCETPEEIQAALGAAPGDGPRAVVIHCSNERPAYPPGAFSVNPRQEAHGLHAALAKSAD